jgi:hypothetical protein
MSYFNVVNSNSSQEARSKPNGRPVGRAVFGSRGSKFGGIQATLVVTRNAFTCMHHAYTPTYTGTRGTHTCKPTPLHLQLQHVESGVLEFAETEEIRRTAYRVHTIASDNGHNKSVSG